MNRIEGNIGTQVGDVVRPRQSASDRRNQVEQERIDAGDAAKAIQRGAPPSAEQVAAAARDLQQIVEIASGKDLQFRLHEEARQLVVQVTERGSGKLIKQIPPEEMMDLHVRITEALGMLLDQRA